MKIKNLSLVIPTYNRHEKLNCLIKSIVSQKESEFIEILIIDNCSFPPVKNRLINESNVKVSIVENKYNVGLSGNILKCFEYCSTPWMWMIGDDDLILPGAIKIVLEKIRDNGEVGFFSFQSSLNDVRKITIESDLININKEKFVDNIFDFSTLLFISSGVYNLRILRPDLKIGYMYSHTLASHIAILFDSLNRNNCKTMFCKEKIVIWGSPDNNSTWSTFVLMLNQSDLIQILDISSDFEKVLYNKLQQAVPFFDLKFKFFELKKIKKAKYINLFPIKLHYEILYNKKTLWNIFYDFILYFYSLVLRKMFAKKNSPIKSYQFLNNRV